MNFTINKEDDLAIFTLSDPRLDSVSSPDIKAELLILCQEDIHVLIIDLSAVTFCDSSGLSALLLAERQMRDKDGGVLVVDKAGKIRSLLEIAKLDSIIPVFPSIADARAALEE
ncbi:MAG: STAS domain-containing protein [Ignavibacteria bacterium]|nr:STAS domain-containing protein [Ignavibacteria bacterium]